MSFNLRRRDLKVQYFPLCLFTFDMLRNRPELFKNNLAIKNKYLTNYVHVNYYLKYLNETALR